MEYDIVVIGGGPAGIAVAWSAAKNGSKVLLIERYGFLGGMATTGLVGPILGHYFSEKEPAVAGFLKFLVNKMAKFGGCEKWEIAYKKGGIPFNSEVFKYAAETLLLEQKVEILYHSFAISSKIKEGKIEEIEIVNKSGIQKIKGEVFVDTTGDADIAYYSGFEYTKGRPHDGKTEAMGCMFKIGGIDEEKLTEEVVKEAGAKLIELREKGDLKIYNTGLGGKGSTIQKGERSFNLTRFAGDGTNVHDLTKGEIELRKQIFKYLKFLKRNVPGFENAYISYLPANIGIRETRQIKGLYTMTEENVISGIKTEDSIARCTYWIDIHCPLGRTKDNVHLCIKECPTKEYCIMLDNYKYYLPSRNKLHPPKNDWFSIPARSLIPEKAKNLVVGGRCISADHKAMGAIRAIATCMATGQAAGIIASLSSKNKIPVNEVPVKEVQKVIKEQEGLY